MFETKDSSIDFGAFPLSYQCSFMFREVIRYCRRGLDSYSHVLRYYIRVWAGACSLFQSDFVVGIGGRLGATVYALLVLMARLFSLGHRCYWLDW